MFLKLMVVAGLALGIAQANAQQGAGASAPVTTQPTTTAPPTTRVPTLGDTRRVNRRVAQNHSRSNTADRQVPSSQNGNQPDRAAAGAGGR